MSDTNANFCRRVLFRSAALAVGVLGSSALIAGCQPQKCKGSTEVCNTQCPK